jgi:hypothetical protein
MNKKIRLLLLLVILAAIITYICLYTPKPSFINDKSAHDFTPYTLDIKSSIDNIKAVPLSSITKGIEYIPLQTIPESLLGEVNKIAISDSFIFVSDFEKLMQFDRQGKFIRKVGSNGRGPGEYVHIFDITVDNKQEVVYILSTRTKDLLSFDFRGNFIKSFKLTESSLEFIADTSNHLLFQMSNLGKPEGTNSYSWFLTDTEGNVLLRISNSLYKTNRLGRFFIVKKPLYLYNGSLHFMEFGIDTLYFFNNDIKTPYAIFKFGDLKIDSDPEVQSQKDLDKYKEKLYISTILEDEKYLYLNISRGFLLDLGSWIFNKKTKELTVLENKGFIDDIKGLATFWPKLIFNDSILIDYIDAYKLLQILNSNKPGDLADLSKHTVKQMQTLKSTLTETSNPVLMIVKQ